MKDLQEDALHDHALEAVPAAKRRTLLQLIVVQIGWNISVSSFLVGGVVGGGTTFGEALLALGLGNLFLVAVASLVGLIGFKTGLTSYLISRVVFGSRGSVLVSLVLGILAMGFIGVLMDAFGAAFTALVPGVPEALVIIFLAGAITATAIFGFRGLAVYSAVAVPVELLVALLALGRIGTLEGGFSEVLDASPAAPIPFYVAMGAAIATWITGAALTSDITRYALRPAHVVISSFVGFVLGAGVFETVATISAMKVGDSNFVGVMSNLGLLLPAVILLVLALWNTTDNNLYSAALAFTNAGKVMGFSIPKPAWTIISVLIALATAFLGLADNFLTWLQVIALVTPPFAGVLIAHFWVMGKIRENPEDLLAHAPSVGIEALVAWIATSVITYYSDWFVDAIVGFVLGGAIYTVLLVARGLFAARSTRFSEST